MLVAGAALLVDAGFAVQLPAGWDGARRVGLRLSARSTPAQGVVVRGGLGREQVAAFRWSLAVGDGADAALDEEEIAALVAAKAPLVRLRGAWVSVDQDRAAPRPGVPPPRRPPAADGRRRARARRGLARPTTCRCRSPASTRDGWLGDLLAGTADRTLDPGRAAGRRSPRSCGPTSSAASPGWRSSSSLGPGRLPRRRHGAGQDRPAARPGGASTRAPGRRPGPTLLICPMSMVGTWEREAARFAPACGCASTTAPAGRAATTCARPPRTPTWSSPPTPPPPATPTTLAEVDWHRLVLDEAQAVKNARCAAARAVRRLPRAAPRRAHRHPGGEPPRRAVVDHGRAQPRHPRHAPSASGRASPIPVERHGDADAAELLRRTTRPYLLRRVKTDPTIVDDLPEKIEITQHYRLTREQATLYRTIVDDMLEKIEDSDRHRPARQRAGGDDQAQAGLQPPGAAAARRLADRPAARARSCGWRRSSPRCSPRATGRCASPSSPSSGTCSCRTCRPGSTRRSRSCTAASRGGAARRWCSRFQARRRAAASCCSRSRPAAPASTLTAANHVVHLDRWWNPAVEEQATDRAFRIGQRRTVQVRTFSAPAPSRSGSTRWSAPSARSPSSSSATARAGSPSCPPAQLRELFALGADALQDDEAATTGGDAGRAGAG